MNTKNNRPAGLPGLALAAALATLAGPASAMEDDGIFQATRVEVDAQSSINKVTMVVAIVKKFVTMETSVPDTNPSMLSTSLDTRFIISPVLVFVKKSRGMRCI